MQTKIYQDGRKENIQLRNRQKQGFPERKRSTGSFSKNPADYYWADYGDTSHVMKTKISYWFFLGLVVWTIIISLRKKGIIIPVFSNYFTDFITVPMYTYLIEYIMNDVLGYYWKPDLKFILSSIMYLSILFEVICPIFSERFTGDILDIVAYFAGGIFYYFFKIILWDFFKSDRV